MNEKNKTSGSSLQEKSNVLENYIQEKSEQLQDFLNDKMDDIVNYTKLAVIVGTIASSIFNGVKDIDAICPDLVSVVEQEVPVTVTDVQYTPSYTTSVTIDGKTESFHHRAEYKTYIEYEGEEFELDDYLTYSQYKNQVKEAKKEGTEVEAIGNVKVKTYKNGKVRYSFESLELEETIYRLETDEGTKKYSINNISEGTFKTTYYTDDNLEIVVSKLTDSCKIYDTSKLFKQKLGTYYDFSFEEVPSLEQQDFSF